MCVDTEPSPRPNASFIKFYLIKLLQSLIKKYPLLIKETFQRIEIRNNPIKRGKILEKIQHYLLLYSTSYVNKNQNLIASLKIFEKLEPKTETKLESKNAILTEVSEKEEVNKLNVKKVEVKKIERKRIPKSIQTREGSNTNRQTETKSTTTFNADKYFEKPIINAKKSNNDQINLSNNTSTSSVRLKAVNKPQQPSRKKITIPKKVINEDEIFNQLRGDRHQNALQFLKRK
jgi:hypothetical protein